jgi:hypothetical protein
MSATTASPIDEQKLGIAISEHKRFVPRNQRRPEPGRASPTAQRFGIVKPSRSNLRVSSERDNGITN